MANYTLGCAIKAARLRWGRLPGGRDGLMRLSIRPNGYLCEFHPLGLVPSDQRKDKTEYVLWWKGDDFDHGQSLILQSPFLRCLRKVNEPFSVTLNEAGERI